MKSAAVDEFFRRLAAIEPEPKTELTYINAYTLLVSVALSAQATDVSVNKATLPLFKLVQTPQQMLDLGETKLKTYIKTIGLYNAKSKNVIAMARLLVDKHDGQVPNRREDLQALPGVGRKTANVILNVYYGEPTLAVDTHVFRVANRTGMARGATPDVVEAKLMKTVPPQWLGHAHHWLILHGRYVCKARLPACPACVVRDLCSFRDKTKAIRED